MIWPLYVKVWRPWRTQFALFYTYVSHSVPIIFFIVALIPFIAWYNFTYVFFWFANLPGRDFIPSNLSCMSIRNSLHSGLLKCNSDVEHNFHITGGVNIGQSPLGSCRHESRSLFSVCLHMAICPVQRSSAVNSSPFGSCGHCSEKDVNSRKPAIQPLTPCELPCLNYCTLEAK